MAPSPLDKRDGIERDSQLTQLRSVGSGRYSASLRLNPLCLNASVGAEPGQPGESIGQSPKFGAVGEGQATPSFHSHIPGSWGGVAVV